MKQSSSERLTKKREGKIQEYQEVKGLLLPREFVDFLEEKAAEAAGRPLESGSGSPLSEVIGRFVELALDAEMSEHLGYEVYQRKPEQADGERGRKNTRNGRTTKRIKTSYGETEIAQPRDREASFRPQIVPKHQSLSPEIAERIINLYASGMTTEDLALHLRDLYGIAASSSLISRVTEAVDPELRQWRNRPLEEIAAVLYVDALHIKIRQSSGVVSTAVYVASAYTERGLLEVIGVWIAPSTPEERGYGESATFWLEALHQLRERGLKKVLMACSDGLVGLQDAITTVWPSTVVFPCVVHLLRNSLQRVSYKQRKGLARALKQVYQAPSYEQAEAALEAMRQEYADRYERIYRKWCDALVYLQALWSLSPALRKIVYTSNPLENTNRQVRKVTKNRGLFPHNESALRLVTLVLREVNHKAQKRRARPEWPEILAELHVRFADQLPENWGYRCAEI